MRPRYMRLWCTDWGRFGYCSHLKHIILEMKHIGKTFPGLLLWRVSISNLPRAKFIACLAKTARENPPWWKYLVSGAYQKTTGQILFEGQEVQIKNPMHAQQLGISTIYQELNLIPHLTVGENIYPGREPRLFSGVHNSYAGPQPERHLPSRFVGLFSSF